MSGTHARLSASSAERWLQCPGSPALTRMYQAACDASNTEKEYTIEGTGAHEVAGECLKSGEDAYMWIGRKIYDGKVTVTGDMSEHVQLYLDYVRSFEYKNLVVETRLTDPEVGTDFGGTADCYAASMANIGSGLAGMVHVFDYKHGEGIAVEAEDNAQLKYYAFGVLRKIIREHRLKYDCALDVNVGITIVQPRAWHDEGPIREVWLKGTEIMRWGNEVLLPAMAATEAEDAPLKSGEHCRFCPVKAALLCPVLTEQFDDISSMPLPEMLTDERLGIMFEYSDTVKMTLKSIEEEVLRRNTTRGGRLVPGTKVVPKKAYSRVWKDGVAAKAEAAFKGKNMSVYTTPEIKSPAQIDKDFGSAGKKFTAAEAFKPDTGLTVALVSDNRTGVPVKSLDDMFAGIKKE